LREYREDYQWRRYYKRVFVDEPYIYILVEIGYIKIAKEAIGFRLTSLIRA